MMRDAQTHLSASFIHDLEHAAVYAEKRKYFLQRALHKYIAIKGASAIAFIRFAPFFERGYSLIYVGENKQQTLKWLEGRLTDKILTTLSNLSDLNKFFSETVQLSSYDNGILITWYYSTMPSNDAEEKILLEGLQALSYVEENEHVYFYDKAKPFEPELSELIKQKDTAGLTELLSLTKIITKSDIVFWGDTNSKQVEVDMHLGSKDHDFGFHLPIGKGIGGLAAKDKKVLHVDDYQNCEYRYHEVSTAVDQEDIRTVLALPLKDKQQSTSGILYVSNRDINPIPFKKKLLLLRLGHGLEPLIKQTELKQFFTPSQTNTFYKQKKTALRSLTQSARHLGEIEKWLSELLDGSVLILDGKGNSFTKQVVEKTQKKTQYYYAYPLVYKERNIGEISIWTDMKLPLQNGWPDLIDDVLHAIYIIYERTRRFYQLVELERTQWLENIMSQTMNLPAQYQKGLQLRAPLDRGEIWAIYWNKNGETLTPDERIQLDEIALADTKQPIYFKGNSGYILFDQEANCTPDEFRNNLLKKCPVETWLVHGATYSSFTGLQKTLLQLQVLLEKVTMTQGTDFVLEFDGFGLEYLLSNPRFSDDLNKFSLKALQPLIIYDKENDSQLTETLALSLIYQSPTAVAKRLFVHTNTVHYRVNRAKEILQVNLDTVGNEIALTLAAYTWLFHHYSGIDFYEINHRL